MMSTLELICQLGIWSFICFNVRRMTSARLTFCSFFVCEVLHQNEIKNCNAKSESFLEFSFCAIALVFLHTYTCHAYTCHEVERLFSSSALIVLLYRIVSVCFKGVDNRTTKHKMKTSWNILVEAHCYAIHKKKKKKGGEEKKTSQLFVWWTCLKWKSIWSMSPFFGSLSICGKVIFDKASYHKNNNNVKTILHKLAKPRW